MRDDETRAIIKAFYTALVAVREIDVALTALKLKEYKWLVAKA